MSSGSNCPSFPSSQCRQHLQATSKSPPGLDTCPPAGKESAGESRCQPCCQRCPKLSPPPVPNSPTSRNPPALTRGDPRGRSNVPANWLAASFKICPLFVLYSRCRNPGDRASD